MRIYSEILQRGICYKYSIYTVILLLLISIIMRISELLHEDIDQAGLDQIERFADGLWAKLGIDIKFTHHFMDRLNDPRNGKAITSSELIRLLKQEYQRYGRIIAGLDSGSEAVLRDLVSDLNLPFVIQDRGNGQQLVGKTIMRKQNFSTPDPVYAVNEGPTL